MKKEKLPGTNISLKTKKNESPAVMEWLNCQTNLMDSIRYLIENEIRANGVRNLQLHIPAERPPIRLPSELAAESAERFAAAAVEGGGAAAARRHPAPGPEDDIDEDDIASWV